MQVTTLDPMAKTQPKEGYRADFFGKPAYLTVSGQLHGECLAHSHAKIYTFGPTFRAENSHTSRHLADFWLVEPEIAFFDLNDNMSLAEEFLKFLTRETLKQCSDELKFFAEFYQLDITRLEKLVNSTFTRISYTEAIEILLKSGQTFEYPVEWGCDLQTEHERYLVEKVFNGPTFVYDYPKDRKAFYMRVNEDRKTVAAMDLLVPGVGEIMGGSQREERLSVLESRMAEQHIGRENLEWYLDLRRYGTVVHSGFGLGFERAVMYLTGMQNIRDVILFPRYPQSIQY